MSRIFLKYGAVLFLLVFSLSACSVRSVQIKRAEERYKKGQYYSDKGETDRAISYFEKSLAISRASGFQPGVANNLNELAIIHTGKGESDKARELLNESLKIYQDHHMETEISKTLNNIARTYVREQNFHEALKRFDVLIKWDTQTGNETGIGISLFNMGRIYGRHLNMHEEARLKYGQALKIFEKTGNEKFIRLTEKELQKY